MNLLIPRDNFNLNDPSMCKNGDSSIVDVRNRIVYIYILSNQTGADNSSTGFNCQMT